MTQITFGKWQGWDTERMAKFTDGRSYLAWGAENLKAPQWRKEFQRALDSIPATEIDLDLEAQSIMHSDAQIDPEDAYILARDARAELIEDQEREKVYEAAKTRFYNNLREVAISDMGINAIFNMIERHGIEELAEAEKYGKIKFTSPAKRDVVWQAAIGFDGDLDNIEF